MANHSHAVVDIDHHGAAENSCVPICVESVEYIDVGLESEKTILIGKHMSYGTRIRITVERIGPEN